MKIGLIAGDGDLPGAVIEGARGQGHDVFVASLKGQSETLYEGLEQAWFGYGEFGKITKAFKKAGCTHVCFAGHVSRPNFKDIRPDLKTAMLLPGAIKAARGGDDGLLGYVVKSFEKSSFEVVSPQSLCAALVLGEGPLGKVNMTSRDRDDADKAMQIAADIGRLDIGQGAVVCGGLVLAVEAQEGTDAMLARIAVLPENIRGNAKARAGVLAKRVKPGQDARIDLPTLGPQTIKRAAAAGLAGIVAQSGGAFVLRRDETMRLADEAGLFVVGVKVDD